MQGVSVLIMLFSCLQLCVSMYFLLFPSRTTLEISVSSHAFLCHDTPLSGCALELLIKIKLRCIIPT